MLTSPLKNISKLAAAFVLATTLSNSAALADSTHTNTARIQTSDHNAAQAFAASITKRTYATNETRENLGDKIFNNLSQWSGNKPVFVLRLEDFGANGSTPETVRQKLIEIGMPLQLIPNDETLGNLSERINKNQNKNYYAAAFPFGAYGIMIGISDTAELRTKETIALATGFPIEMIERFPTSETGHKEIIYKHEAGHIKRHIPVIRASDRTRSEIMADQNAADIDGEEWPTKEDLTNSFSTYHLLMAKTIGLVHVPGQNLVANTIPNIYMPWETRPAELEGKLLFEGNSLQNLRPLRMKAAEGITDRGLWLNGIQQVAIAASYLKHIPEDERHTMASLTEYIIPQSVIDLIFPEGKYSKQTANDFKNNSLEDFIAMYQDHPEFLDAVKERIAFVMLKDNKDKDTVERFIVAAHKRLAEISNITIEKRFLEKYLEATQYYFPDTFDQANKNMQQLVAKPKIVLPSPAQP